MYVCTHVCGAHRDQKMVSFPGTEVRNLSTAMWMLGVEPGSSVRVVCALDH